VGQFCRWNLKNAALVFHGLKESNRVRMERGESGISHCLKLDLFEDFAFDTGLSSEMYTTGCESTLPLTYNCLRQLLFDSISKFIQKNHRGDNFKEGMRLLFTTFGDLPVKGHSSGTDTDHSPPLEMTVSDIGCGSSTASISSQDNSPLFTTLLKRAINATPTCKNGQLFRPSFGDQPVGLDLTHEQSQHQALAHCQVYNNYVLVIVVTLSQVYHITPFFRCVLRSQKGLLVY
jgi:hypothetical protein